MGVPSSSTKSGAISDEQKEVILAKLEELFRAKFDELSSNCNNKQRDDKFLVDTEAGVLLWSIVSGICVLVLQKVLCCIGDVLGVWKVLRDLYDKHYNGPNGPQPLPPPEDVCLAVGALAVGPEVTQVDPGDVERAEQEIERRQWVRSLLCPAQSTVRSSQSVVSGTIDSSYTTTPEEDTVNRQIYTSLNLQHTTLASPKERKILVEKVQAVLPAHAAPVQVSDGSTCLSTTVSIAASALQELLDSCAPVQVSDGSTCLSTKVSIGASALQELLDCAACLLKLGLSSYDTVCTVQLGNTALLYGMRHENNTTADNAILLEEGIHDVPYITSVKRLNDRTIVVKGIYLQNTGIRATTQTYGESFSLNVLHYRKLERGLEMILAQIPKGKPLGEKISIHAKKTIQLQLEGCTVGLTLRSNDAKVDIIERKSSQGAAGILCSKRFWICFMVLYGYQVALVSSWRFSQLKWILSLFIWLLCYLFLDYIIGPWIYKISIHCLELMMRMNHFYLILTSRELADKYSIVERNEAQDSPNLSTTSKTRQDDWNEDTRKDPSLDETDAVAAVSDPNWEWPCFERIFRDGNWVIQREPKVKLENSVKWPFEVVKTVEPDTGMESVGLILRSAHLIQVLNECQPQTGVRFEEGSQIERIRELFLRLKSLKQYAAASTDGAEPTLIESVWHVKHLVRFVEWHFADTVVQYERMKAEGRVSFDMLWAFLVPGEDVRRRCLITNQECYGTISHFRELRDDHKVTLNVMDFNVQSYHKCTMDYQISPFHGEVSFASLEVCPLRFLPDPKQLKDRFVRVGAIFYQVAMQQPCRFMQFKGSMNFLSYENRCWRLRKLNADGRVMVDLLSFARMNPDYPLENAKPPCEVMTGMWSSTGDQMKQPSDEELMLAPAFVYGFSFQLKRWGCFELCGLREISFNEKAFDALRMNDERQKMILWSVVQSYIVKGEESRLQSEQTIDPIPNKGTGCIVLCHGPPGTGKTMTAEALAETLQRPLWSISAFELGEEPHKVETRLIQIMEVASNWRAILLLDEADAYLQKRDEGVDVHRNLLTGVFLRVLEYHRGIMFLTTNRVSAFDDAILSRTTLAISYPALEETQRREIWKMFLSRAGIQNVTYDALIHHELNGRQIRNIVHLAQLLANGRKEHLNITHVIQAIDAYVSCTKELPGAAPS